MASTQTPSRKQAKDAKLNELSGDDDAEKNGVVGKVLTAQVNEVTGGIEIDGLVHADTLPVICIGGDHPYNQLWGSNGQDGLAALYKSFGVTPYIALNTRSMSGEGVGAPFFMGWSKVKSLSDSGFVEPVAHGARHYQDWEAPDAGIHVKYTGSASTATMYVTALAVIGTTAGAVEDFNFTFASYSQIDQLVAAIDALPNWSCRRSTELSGTEATSTLLTIASGNAKDCKYSLPDSYGRRFSMCGGIRAFWDSSVTNVDSLVFLLMTSTLNVYKDGVNIGSFTLSGYTLGSLLTAIKALNSAFGTMTTLVADGSGQQAYCTGEEDASNLSRGIGTSMFFDAKRSAAVLTGGGLTTSYLRHRNMITAAEDCAANGVAVRTFAQSGGRFWGHLPAAFKSGIYSHYRGDPRWITTAPCAMPVSDANRFHTHINLGNLYNSTNYIDTLVDSLIDSRGFIIDLLIHNVMTDAVPNDGTARGSSGYFLDSANVSGDITEAPFVYLLSRLNAAADSGLIRIATHSEINNLAHRALPPANLLYNPRLKARGDISTATDLTGKSVPGWRLDAFSLPAISAIDGGIEFTMAGSIKDVLSQRVSLERGRRYRGGFRVACSNGTPTMLAIRIQSAYGSWPDSMVGSQMQYIQSQSFTRPNDDVEFDFEIPYPVANGNPRIISQAQPFNLALNKNIQLGMEGVALFDIDCSVGAANAAAATAKEVAAAINSAIAANAAYYGRPELHNVARAENSRVVIEMPRRQGWPASPGPLTLSNGSTLNASTVLFGASFGYAWSNHGGENDASRYPVEFRVSINAPVGTRVQVIEPYLIEYSGGR